jgi:peptidoglycan/LPS O-acetylase OafA/YrhL
MQPVLPAAPSRFRLFARGAPPSSIHAFRPDIEGLRGVAVLLVVLYHVGIPWTPGGYVGVDVFFVLSGYLISGLVVREVERTGRLDLVSFYGRRARRLLPSSALVVLCTLLVGWLLYSPSELETLSSSALAASAYVSNFFFASRAGDYFAPDTRANPLLHTWSLAVEEQFYLLWPALIVLFLRGRSSRRVLAIGVGAVSALTFGLSLWLTPVNPPLAFYSSFTRAWEFGLGALVFLAPEAWARRQWVAGVLGWCGLALVLGTATLLSDRTPYPGTAALLPVLGTAALLFSGTNVSGAGVGALLGNRALLYVGRISYLWYLWHWPAMVYGMVVFQPLGGYARLIGGGVSLVLAALTHHLFENPIRYHTRLVPRPRLSLVLALAVTVLGMGVAAGGRSVAAAASRRPEQIAFTRAAADEPAMMKQGCLVSYLEATKECVFGEGARPLVLLGDSHAAQWAPALERIARAHGWRLVTMTRAMCPWVELTLYNGTLRREYRECEESRRAALARIGELAPVAVVLSEAHAYPSRPGRLPGPQFTVGEWEGGARRTLAHLDSAGVRTIVLLDNPMLEEPTAACLARAEFHGRDDDCASRRGAALDESVLRAESAAGAGLPHVSVVDLTDRFCGSVTCDAVRDGMIVYRDRGHLTATFAAHLAPVLEERMGLESRLRE